MRRFPLLILALGVVCGVWAGEVIPCVPTSALFGLFLLLAFCFVRQRSFWIFFFLASCLAGNLLLQRELAWDRRPEKHIAYLKPGPSCLRGIVLQEPSLERKGQVVKFKFIIEARHGGSREKVWVTLINTSGIIHQGDDLVVVGELQEVLKRGRYRPGPRFRILGIGKQSYFLMRKDRVKVPFFDRLSQHLGSRFQDLLPDPEAGILRTMILGARARIEEKWMDIFSRLGVIHVLSVSGFHMAAIGFFLYLLGRLALRGPRFSIAVTLSGLFFYYLLSGQAAPSLRSLIMAFTFFSGRLLGREGNALNALSLALILSLFIKPTEFFTLSFQLSYLTVLGLVLSFTVINSPSPRSPLKVRGVRGVMKHILDLGKASLAAFLFSFGLVAHIFGPVSIATVLVNAVFSPLFTVIVILGFLLMPASALGEGIGGFFSLLVYLPTHLFLEAAERLSTMPLFASRGAVLSTQGTIFYYAGLTVLCAGVIYRKKLMAWIFNRRLIRFFSQYAERIH